MAVADKPSGSRKAPFEFACTSHPWNSSERWTTRRGGFSGEIPKNPTPHGISSNVQSAWAVVPLEPALVWSVAITPDASTTRSTKQARRHVDA